MIGGAGGFDLVRGGAVQQHRIPAVGAHDVIYQSPDIPFRARGLSGPLAGPDQCEALGESVIRPAQQVEGDHARPCLPGAGAFGRAAEEAVAGGLAARDRIGVAVEGTPLAHTKTIDPLDFVRTIAVARITMPASMVRLSAGREDMSEETQALCFIAGANSIFYGPKLLTTPNPGRDRDMALLDKLGLREMD